MDGYLTVKGISTAEYTEKHSRFIGAVAHCENEGDALAFIGEVKARHWDARHNVFAYRLRDGTARFSDDGEPHSTAGKPVLDVINGAGICDVIIVVTRYFGGVLLGTGGLVRAYSTAAGDALANAERVIMLPCTVFSTVCGYTNYKRLADLLEKNGAVTENTDFTENVTVTYCLRDRDVDRFKQELREAFSAVLEATELCRKISAFNIDEA